MNVSWSPLHHGTGPSPIGGSFSLLLLCSVNYKLIQSYMVVEKRLTKFWNIPMTSENLPNYWIVRFLGHWAFTSSMISTHVPPNHLHHPILRIFKVCDPTIQNSWLFQFNLNYLNKSTSRINRGVRNNRRTFPRGTFVPK